jgi:uncharacterized protein YqgV (UPF0045/DUF77 family)
MELSAELSLYPLTGDVDTSVLAFIEDLHESGEISVVTNTMSTQISGDWDAVMRAVNIALKRSSQRIDRQVLVVKYLPRHRIEIGAEG